MIEENELDPLLLDAARLIVEHQVGKASILQRHLKLGYMRAGRIMDQLEDIDVVGKYNGAKPREVLCSNEAELETLLTFKGLL